MWVFFSMWNVESLTFGIKPVATTQGKLIYVGESGIQADRRTVYQYGYEYTIDNKKLTGLSYREKPLSLLTIGSPIIVEYQRHQPDISRVQGMRLKPHPISTILYLLIFPLIGIAFLLLATKEGLHHIHIARNGILTPSTVIKKIPTDRPVHARTWCEVFFSFETLEGVQVTVSFNRRVGARLAKDATGILVYDRKRPQEAVPLELLDKSVRKLFGFPPLRS